MSVHDEVTTTTRRHSWAEFQQSGMLWLANTTLHVFGWAVVIELDDDTGTITSVYPVRTRWRGFPQESNDRGHKRVAEYMAKAAPALVKEASE